MTILDLIKAACKTKGVPEKYAERIQKTFKIEKAEGMEAFVDLFKDNILPAIQEAENEAKTTAETAAVAAYEAKHGLKDGKPVEDPDKNKKTEEELLKDLSPELKAYLESMRKSVDDMAKKVGDSITNSANEAKKETELYNQKNGKVSVDFSQGARIMKNEQRLFNVGYLFLQSLVTGLRLDKICRSIKGRHKYQYDLLAVFTDLIYARILHPSSKRESYEYCKTLLEPPKYYLQDVYRALGRAGGWRAG